MRAFNRTALAVILTLATRSMPALALPIGFGTNQGDLQYDERRSDHFTVYHDHRVPHEGLGVLNSLEAARPHLERWMGVHRTTPLPVIMSAVSENASFANFITDAIELQTMGQGGRDLAWHEYTHSTMYRSLDNWFGPAGNILHLPWMPAWFLEGLADAMAVTVSSDGMAGIERYQALSGDWPSYDRLHSLYSKFGFAERGYATSAAFVRYIFRKGDPNKLAATLDRFYRVSMPWWWPYTAVPFVDSLPMDRALVDFTGMNGEELYESYKADAKVYWEAHGDGRFLLGDKGARRNFESVRDVGVEGDTVVLKTVVDDHFSSETLPVDAATGWVVDSKVKAYKPVKEEPLPAKRKGLIWGQAAYGKRVAWIEQEQETMRFCTDERCVHEVHFPKALRHLGNSRGTMWIAEQEERLTGTRYGIGRFDLSTSTLKSDFIVTEARPIAATVAGQDLWILTGERNARTIRRYDENGTCTAMLAFKDHVVDIYGLANGGLVLALYAGDKTNLRLIPKPLSETIPCRPEDRHVSPLLAAIALGGTPDLKTALAASEIWTAPAPKTAAATAKFMAEVPVDQNVQPGTNTTPAPEPARWRPRPLFAFPWIGADDAMGPQIGIVSVPLMDEMQNESIRLTMLYGVPSNFPYTEISLDSSRFKPDVGMAVYRQQTYNGRFSVAAEGDKREIKSSYLDERGIRFTTSISKPLLGGTASYGAGLKLAELRPYMGPEINGEGSLVEPAANVGLGHRVGRFNFTQSLSGRVAPESLNKHFDYNQVGFSSSIGANLPFLESRSTVGIEGSRTRGKKMRDLREMYTPLKVFIPGSGGGLNQNSYPLAGEGSGLFSPIQGNTQGRARVDWTAPVVRDVDKELWIIYLERLDFTAFYNYGAAWAGAEPHCPSGDVCWDKLIRAHGYSLDLQMENKGVRFNVGLGTGQVVGRDFETYLSAGFDALF